MARTVNQAFDAFVFAARRAGAMVVIEPFAAETNCVARVVRKRGELRLTWYADSQRLVLEIDHGPPDGPPVGWLDLFDARCEGGVLPPEVDVAVGFDSSVEYGLELMGFPRI